jgi:hypothetical protein
VGITDGTVIYKPRIEGTAVNYTAMSVEITTLAMNNFSIALSSDLLFPTEAVEITLTPTYIPIADIAVRVRVECDTQCQQNILLDGEVTVSPSALIWRAGDGTASSFIVRGDIVGKNFLVVVEVDSDPRGLFGFPARTFRITAPPQREIIVSKLPATLYVGAQYPVTIRPSYAPDATAGQVLTATVALSEAVMVCTPSSLTWGAGGADGTVEQTMVCVPSIPVANVSAWWTVTTSVSGYVDSQPQAFEILTNTPVYVSGVQPTVYVGASIIEVRFALDVVPSFGETLELLVTVNSSVALSPQPPSLDLSFGTGSASVIALYPGKIIGEYEDVLVTFDSPSTSGKYVPSQRTAVVRVYRPKRVLLTSDKRFIDVGSSAVMSARIDRPTLPALFATSFTAGETAVRVQPATLYFSTYSPLRRPITVTGISATSLETFSIATAASDEFVGAAASVQLQVAETQTVTVSAPRTISTTNSSSMIVTLGGSPIQGGAVVFNMVTVTMVAEPAVLMFEPPSVTFDSAVLTQSLRVSGDSVISGVKLSFRLSGSYASAFRVPAALEIDVAKPNVVQVSLASSVEMFMGFPVNITLDMPFPLTPYDTFALTPTLTCPSLSPVIGFSQAIVRWTSVSSLKRIFELQPLAPTSPCSLTFTASGNSTTIQGPSGVWSVAVKALPEVSFMVVPTSLYASTTSTSTITLAMSTTPTIDFSVTALIPDNVTYGTIVTPLTLSWEAGAKELTRSWTIQVNDSSIPFVSLGFAAAVRPAINAIALKQNLTIPVRLPTGIAIVDLPSFVYVGGQNAKSFSFLLTELPIIGERVDVSIAYTGASGSMLVEPTTISWIGGQSSGFQSSVTVEGVLPQSSGELVITISAPARFGSRTERRAIPILDLVKFAISPSLPVVFLPSRTYDFTITMPTDVATSSLPGVVNVMPDFLGIPSCLFFQPTFVKFGPLLPRAANIRLITTEMGCGTAILSFTVSGWAASQPTLVRKVVTVAPRQRLQLTPRIPAELVVGQVVYFTVNAVQAPEFAGERLELAFHRENQQCLDFTPAALTWVKGDELPLARIIRVTARCPTDVDVHVLPSFAGTTSQLHELYVPSWTTRIIGAVPMPIVMQWPVSVYVSTVPLGYQIRTFDGTDSNPAPPLLDFAKELIIRATKVYVKDPLAGEPFIPLSQASLVDVDGTVMEDGNVTVDFSAVATNTRSVRLRGLHPGGEMTATLSGVSMFGSNSSDEVLALRTFSVLPVMRMTRGTATAGQTTPYNFAYYRYARDTAGVVNTTGFDYDEHRNEDGLLVYPIVPGDAMRAALGISVSYLPELSDDIVGTQIPWFVLTPIVRSPGLLVFNPPSMTYAMGGRTSQTTVLTAADVLVETNVTVDFAVSGPSAAHVDAASVAAMSMVVVITPKLYATVCIPPVQLLVGDGRSVECAVSVPALEQGLTVSLAIAGSKESIRVSPIALSFSEVDATMVSCRGSGDEQDAIHQDVHDFRPTRHKRSGPNPSCGFRLSIQARASAFQRSAHHSNSATACFDDAEPRCPLDTSHLPGSEQHLHLHTVRDDARLYRVGNGCVWAHVDEHSRAREIFASGLDAFRGWLGRGITRDPLLRLLARLARSAAIRSSAAFRDPGPCAEDLVQDRRQRRFFRLRHVLRRLDSDAA